MNARVEPGAGSSSDVFEKHPAMQQEHAPVVEDPAQMSLTLAQQEEPVVGDPAKTLGLMEVDAAGALPAGSEEGEPVLALLGYEIDASGPYPWIVRDMDGKFVSWVQTEGSKGSGAGGAGAAEPNIFGVSSKGALASAAGLQWRRVQTQPKGKGLPQPKACFF